LLYPLSLHDALPISSLACRMSSGVTSHPALPVPEGAAQMFLGFFFFTLVPGPSAADDAHAAGPALGPPGVDLDRAEMPVRARVRPRLGLWVGLWVGLL